MLDDILKPITALVEYAQKKVDDTNKTIDTIHSDLKEINAVREMSSRIETKINGLDSRVIAIENTVSKNLNADIQGVHKNIDRTYSRIEEIGSSIGEKLSGRLDGVDTNLSGVTETLNCINSNVAEILRIQRDEIAEFRKSAEKLTVVRTELETAQAQIHAKDGEISNLRGEIEELKKSEVELARVRTELKTAQAQIRAKDDELARMNGDLKTARDNFNALKQNDEVTIANLNQQIKLGNGEIGRMQASLQTIESERDAARENLSAWWTALEIYKPVRDALRNCETFKSLLETRGLTDDSNIGLIAYVQELGKTMEFLVAVHQAARDFRTNNVQPMTAAEIRAYEALNKCYRRIWQIEFDVFTTPGSRKPLSEVFEKTAFNKDEAWSLKYPTTKTFKFTQGIYVPMLLTQTGKMYKQAIVEAGNF